MDKFEYKVSVIVPVYNVENYLRDCLDSLLAQTMDHDEMEVLLINDGSTDNSLAICEEYAELFGMFKVFSQENAGVSAARNVGIRNAKGKYIFFLDSDDTLESESVKNVTNFFDQHYDEIDVVTYYDRDFIDGKEVAPHLRYKYLTKTGIYDLEKEIFAFQIRLPLVIKNKFKNNIYFLENMDYQEDQEYCCRLLRDNLKLGYVKEAVYNYFQISSGLVQTSSCPLYSFESTLSFFEDLFSQYNGNVSKYFQALFFHDIKWKFATGTLYPYHYDKQELEKAYRRVEELLKHVSNQVIMAYPNADNYQKLYWIRQKKINNETAIFDKKQLTLVSEGIVLYHRKDVEVILKRIQIQKNKLKLVGYFKSPFFSYCDDFKLYVNVNGKLEKLPLVSASASYYKAKEKTDSFWSIIFEREIVEYTELAFLVEFSGMQYKTVWYNSLTTPFYNSFLNEYSSGNLTVRQNRNSLEIMPLMQEELKNKIQESMKNNSTKACKEIAALRSMYSLPEKEIWLYYDNNTVLYDNGYYQFKHDFDKDDGIERYYINTYLDEDNSFLFTNDMKKNVVEFGSLRHKMLFLKAKKIITAFIEIESLSPFQVNILHQVLDIFNAEIVYLQHGVLHAHLPWYYTPIGVCVDKVVISSYFEEKNFIEIYGFRKKDLIPTGMARYDYIDKTSESNKKKILFAPSWRSYLVGKIKENNGKRDGFDNKFKKSSYFKNISDFLYNPHLLRILKENNIEMSVKLHPNFLTVYRHLIDFENEFVILAPPRVELSEYSLFITDFSSFVFDYAYLSRPIIYFVPDYLEFKSGMNRYRKLDLPYEKAFGNLTVTPESVIDEIARIIKNDFVPDAVFKERMDNFYLPLHGCTERLYRYLVEEKRRIV